MKRLSRVQKLLASSLLVAALGAACSKEAAFAPQASMAAPAEPAAPPRAAEAAPGYLAGAVSFAAADQRVAGAARQAPRPPAPEDAAAGRKIVRTGNLELSVDAFEPVRERIDALVAASHAFVANAQVTHSDGKAIDATLVLRIPTDGYESLVAQLGKLGTVDSESSKADDVTAEWVDVSARLSNARKLEARLVELAAKDAGNVSQLLEVETKLGQVREEIERYEGQLHVLDDQVTLSTLTLHVVTRSPYVAPVQPTFGGAAGRALADSWRTLTEVARGLALAGVGALPWLPLVAAAIYGVRFARRRVRRALPAAKVAVAAGGDGGASGPGTQAA